MDQIPVIDLRSSSSVSDIADAAERFGFFQLVGHSLDSELIEAVWTQAHAFFDRSSEEKRRVLRTKENSRGYYDRELTKNARDQKEVFDFAHVPFPELGEEHPDNHLPVDGNNQWPSDMADFQKVMTSYLSACETLALELLEAFCVGLGLASGRLAPHFNRHHTSFIRLNYYPLLDPLSAEEAASVTDLGDMALHHHTDAGAFTILLQDDVGGLQVESGGEWVDVTPEPGGLVINTGDMMQVWSNDKYSAALHRVAPRSTKARYSLPYFFNPSYDTDYAPLLESATESARYRTLNWGEFRQARADGDYGDYGEEIQISQFRI